MKNRMKGIFLILLTVCFVMYPKGDIYAKNLLKISKPTAIEDLATKLANSDSFVLYMKNIFVINLQVSSKYDSLNEKEKKVFSDEYDSLKNENNFNSFKDNLNILINPQNLSNLNGSVQQVFNYNKILQDDFKNLNIDEIKNAMSLAINKEIFKEKLTQLFATCNSCYATFGIAIGIAAAGQLAAFTITVIGCLVLVGTVAYCYPIIGSFLGGSIKTVCIRNASWALFQNKIAEKLTLAAYSAQIGTLVGCLATCTN